MLNVSYEMPHDSSDIHLDLLHLIPAGFIIDIRNILGCDITIAQCLQIVFRVTREVYLRVETKKSHNTYIDFASNDIRARDV